MAATALSLGFEPIGFVDDFQDAEKPVVIGDREFWISRDLNAFRPGTPVHVALGDNATRERVSSEVMRAGQATITLRHPRAAVEPGARVAVGGYVGPLAVVGANAHLARGCIVNSGAIVEHDCELGDFCHAAPGSVLGGGVRVGLRALLGLGCRVLPGLRIGHDAVVGAGSVVLRDVADGETVHGVVN